MRPAPVMLPMEAIPSPLLRGDALVTAQSASTYLTSFLVAALCMALLVAAFVQLLSPLMAGWGQRVGVRGWLSRASRSLRDVEPGFYHSDRSSEDSHTDAFWLVRALRELDEDSELLLHEAVSRVQQAQMLIKEQNGKGTLFQLLLSSRTGKVRLAPFFGTGVSDEHFMYGIQGELRAAVARPSEQTPLLMLATAGASLEEVMVPLVAVDLLATWRPEAALRLGNAGEIDRAGDRFPALAAAAAAIAALDQQVGLAVERALDDLQRSLARLGAWTMRVVSIGLGVAGSLFGSLILDLPSNVTLWSIGVTGGVLSILLRDGVSAAVSRSFK